MVEKLALPAWHTATPLSALADVDSFIVSVAQLVTLLQAPVTTTQYDPASAVVIDARLYVAPVAPGISTPFFRH